MALDTRTVSNGQPAAADSSATIASSDMPAPPPPYSLGTLMPMNPALPRSLHSPDIGVDVRPWAAYSAGPWAAVISRTAARRSAYSAGSAKSVMVMPS